MTDQFGVNSPGGRAMFLEALRIVCHYCQASAKGLCESCALKKAVDGLRPLPKTEMRLIWHNCKLYLPREEKNDDLYLWDGHYVFPVEYASGYFSDNGNPVRMDHPEDFWWADLSQTTSKFFREEEE